MPKLLVLLQTLPLVLVGGSNELPEENSGRDLQYGGPCYICGSEDISVGSPNQAMSFEDIFGNSVSTTCGALEEEAKSDPDTLWANHNQCQRYMTEARRQCNCPGLSATGGFQTTDGCYICGSGGSVKSSMENSYVDTGAAGKMPCGILVEKAAEGLFSSDICATVTSNVQSECCDVSSSGSGSGSALGVRGSENSSGLLQRGASSVVAAVAAFVATMMVFQ